MEIGKGAYDIVYANGENVYKEIQYEYRIYQRSDIQLEVKYMTSTNIREIAFLNYMKSIQTKHSGKDHVIHPIKINDRHISMNNGGITLSQYYKENDISIADIRNILRQILLGIDYMHNINIIHCDIKPNNILINDGLVRLCDFNSSTINTGRTKGLVYTSWYRPLECLNSTYTTKSDIWAIGCTLYELLYKIPLFANLNRGTTNEDTFARIIERLGMPSQLIINKYSLHKFANNMPTNNMPANNVQLFDFTIIDENLNDLLCKMLSYDADKRPTAAQALSHKFFTIKSPNQPRIASIPRIKPKYFISTPLLDYYLNCGLITHLIYVIAKNLLGYLIANHSFSTTHIYQWVILCLISNLADNESLDFYTDYKFDDDIFEIDYGVAIQDILNRCNFNLIV